MIELLIVILVLVAATYLTALGLALHLLSPSALDRYLEQRGKSQRGQWLIHHLDAAMVSVSLLQAVARVAFFVLVLAMLAPIGDVEALTWPVLLIAGGISILGLWISNTVIARAIARYAPVSIVARSMAVLRVITFVLGPIASSLAFIDESIRRLSGANLVADDQLIEAELLHRIEDTHKEGALDKDAATMLENIVEFRNTDVGEVMTPRTDIDGIQMTDDLEQIREFIIEAGHSRIPVYTDSLDHLNGILYVKDLIPFLGRDANGFHLEPLLRQPLRVPESKPVSELLSDFQRSEVHMAIVIDEYGGTAGLVTIEDILEEIVGEIHDEHEPEDEEEPTLTTIDETRSEVDGRYHIDDLNEQLALHLPENEDYDTVAGFLLARLGHVPHVGESYETPEARFTALEASTTHVQRIGIELLSQPMPNGEAAVHENAEQHAPSETGHGK